MPFISNYPWDPQDFRFIGSPIDGIQFENDKIILVEFKTASSTFSKRQRVIRDQVERGLVEFKEFRLE
jgi:predicted Holliday junction resolvase-like endonuclease